MDDHLPAAPPALAPGDYYMDGPYVVFTEAYHLKRGSCCGSGCRHCPYKNDSSAAKMAASDSSQEFT
jgi:hypothetical protein